jgi:cytoskeletal protein CcmA (bactofilin family)
MFKKKLKILVAVPLLSILLLLGLSRPSSAATFKNESYALTESEIVEENLYINGETVQIDGVIDGDLLVCSENLTISGTVTGDLYSASSIVDISGNIYGSVFVAAQNVKLSGSVARNAFIGSAFSDVSGSVGKDLIVFAGNTTVTGKVTEDIKVFSSRSNISGTVKGEALVYAAYSKINESLVEGEVYENIDTTTQETTTRTSSFGKSLRKSIFSQMVSINIFSTLLGFVSMYIVGVILIYLAPVKTLQIEKKIVTSLQEFLSSFLIGLAILAVIPVPIIILGITLIGTPLAILISGLLIFAMFFGTIWVESAIGYKILSTVDKTDNKRLLSLLVGRGLSTVVNFIPIVRGLYKMILSTVAVGAIVRTKYDAFQNKSKKKKKSKR